MLYNETEDHLMEDIKHSFWNMIPSAKLTGDPSFEKKNYSYNKGKKVKRTGIVIDYLLQCSMRCQCLFAFFRISQNINIGVNTLIV